MATRHTIPAAAIGAIHIMALMVLPILTVTLIITLMVTQDTITQTTTATHITTSDTHQHIFIIMALEEIFTSASGKSSVFK